MAELVPENDNAHPVECALAAGACRNYFFADFAFRYSSTSFRR